MAVWKWEGIDGSGKKSSGVQEGNSEREVRRLLRAKGIRPTKVLPPSLLELDLGEWLLDHGIGKPFGNKELVGFTRQLAVMVNAGVPILQGLEILFKQEKNPSLRKAIKKISDDVGQGKTLFDALNRQKGFSNLYCNLVKAGESAGILDGILAKLSAYLENQEKLKKQIKSALTYPSIVLTVSAVVVYGMMVFVVPKFAENLTNNGGKLPTITQVVMDVSTFLQNWSLYLVPGVFLAIVILVKFAKSPAGKPLFDQIFMNAPIFGNIIIKGNLSSFLNTLSTMVSSGVPLIESLRICIETVDNTIISNDLNKVKKAVTEGRTLTEPLMNIKYFPPMVAQMVKVGEQTGKLDAMMEKVSKIFQEDVEDAIGQLTKLIEPILIIFLGGFVAVILLAMYMPVFMQASSMGTS